MNPDLPQFEHGLEGWSEITSSYDLAGYLFTIPVAIQVFTYGHRTLTTGVLVGTYDYHSGTDSKDELVKSLFYFKDVEGPLSIDWKQTQAVLAMVALAPGEEEEEHGEDQGTGG